MPGSLGMCTRRSLPGLTSGFLEDVTLKLTLCQVLLSKDPESCTVSPPPLLPSCSKRLSSFIPLLPSFPTVHSQIWSQRYLLSLNIFHIMYLLPQSLSSHELTHVKPMSPTVLGTWEILPKCLLSKWINTWEKSELYSKKVDGCLGRLPGRGTASSLALSWKMITELEEIKEVQPGWSTEGLGNMS